MKAASIVIMAWMIATTAHAGCIKGNCQNGHGTFVFENGSRYIGEFIHGIPNGSGIMHYQNGDKYLGNWKRGLREGKGKLISSFGDVYTGEFRNDNMFGQGEMVYKNEDTYNGHWWKMSPMVRVFMSMPTATFIGVNSWMVCLTDKGFILFMMAEQGQDIGANMSWFMKSLSTTNPSLNGN